MKEYNLNLWIDYKMGNIHNLSENDYKKIKVCEYLIKRIIPCDEVIEMCGDIKNIENNVLKNQERLNFYAVAFKVPVDVFEIRLRDIINENKETFKKVLKKEDNIIYVDFKKSQ